MPRLLITRPQEASERFLAAIRQKLPDVSALISPVMKLRSRDVEPVSDIEALILTSERAVHEACRLGYRSLPVFCVGQRTSDIAQKAGFDVRFFGKNSDDLITSIRSDIIPYKTLHIRGNYVAQDIASKLGIDQLIAYKQVPLPLSSAARKVLLGKESVVLPLFSPRSVRLFKAEIVAPLHLIAMSQAVAEAADELATSRVLVAQEPTADAMVAATCRCVTALTSDPLA